MTSTIRKYARKAKKFFKKRYGGGARGIVRLARDVNMLKTAINSERKYYDRGDSFAAVTSTSSYAFHPLDGLQIGTSELTRTGDQIKALYTSIKIHMENLASASTEEAAPSSTRTMMRVMVILDTNSRYESALSANTLRDSVLAQTADGRGMILSPYQVAHRIGYGSVGDRFKILRDKVIKLDLTQQVSHIYRTNIKWYKNKTKGMRIKYEEAIGGSVAQPDPRLYVLVLSDSGVANISSRILTRTQFVDN